MIIIKLIRMMTDEFAAQTHDMRYELMSLTLIVGLQ